MIYAFEDCTLDTRRCELRRAGVIRHLEPQVYTVLCHLLEHRDRLVTRDELLDHVWGHRFVTPGALSTRIKALRQALGDDGAAQRFIRTVRGRGFRFIAAVTSPATVEPVAATGQQIRFCDASDGVRIAHAASGRGPPLVKTANWLTHLEHDWNSPVWHHWLQALSRHHTLIRYDERGTGLSDREVADLSFESWLRDLETVVDAHGLTRFPLFGISQGCAIAVAFAARHPERVSRLVLYGGFGQGRLRRARTAAERAEAELLIRVLPLGWGRDNPAFRQVFATLFLPDGTPEQMRWFSELQRVSTSPETAVRLRTTSAGIDVLEEAQRVRAPTLVLHATGDAAVPFEQGRLLAAHIPGARFVPLESRNHILLAAEPAWARFMAETQAFLREEESGAGDALQALAPRPAG
jgi:pimeloyl-ACP methyl ester carboxylesterase/DNA-binding winged helix-turn-helix (wHTH) protein